MDFLKKTANKLSSGIELEKLKFERGNLKRQIRHLEVKISTHNQQMELKRTLVEGLEKVNQTFEAVTIMCASNNVISASGTKPQNTNTDADSDDGVEDTEDPDSFENIQKASYASLQSHKDEVKQIIDKLTIMLASGVDKHNAEIEKKKKRIEEINKRLSILRAKK